MKYTSIIAIIALLFVLCVPSNTSARKHEQKTEQQDNKSQKSNKKSKKNKKGEPADTTQKAKPAEPVKGLFSVQKDKDAWFFYVPDSLLEREMLASVRFTSTPSDCGKFGGEMVNQQTVFFQLAPNGRLLLRSKLFINVADTTEQISRAITISNEHPIIGSFKVDSHKDGCYKINVSSFFQEDNPALGIPERSRTEFGLRNMIGDLSYIESIKTFPLNTEVRTVKTYASATSGNATASGMRTGKVTLGLNISFVLLPKEPMQRRIFDPRVGFFTDGFNSYTDGQQRVERKIFAARWRLEARPEDRERQLRGEAVEPIKPIIYYIDPATPKRWRKYLIQGVNDWQSAFEAAGWKNAIQAREWPENDSTMSMEDARYSCIRYLASPIANAYGPNVHDPRTGEILESHICWYHNVMTLVHDWYMVQASSIDEAARKMRYDDELMGQLIRFVSSHEVGHTLGLRHNFGSSSTVPVEKLRDKAYVEANGHTPSIMDYARFNYVAQPEDGISHQGIFPRIGVYDRWAIYWGYSPALADNEHDDFQRLSRITTERLQGHPELHWLDGESTAGRTDPRRQTEDLSDNAMKASTYGVKNLQREVANLFEWTMDDEHDYYGNSLADVYGQMRTQFHRYIGHVARNIGGYLITVRMRGETGDAAEPQPKAKQKEALAWMNDNVMKEPMWLRDVDYARQLAFNPQDLTLVVARYGASQLVGRLTELNELYPADEYLNDMTRMAFSEADNHAKVTPYRIALQTSIVEGLLALVNNNKVRANVLFTLQTLQRKAKSASVAAADSGTRAHWAALYDTIGRALEWK